MVVLSHLAQMMFWLVLLMLGPVLGLFLAAHRQPQRFLDEFAKHKQHGDFGFYRSSLQLIVVLLTAAGLSFTLPLSMTLLIMVTYFLVGTQLAINVGLILAESVARRQLPASSQNLNPSEKAHFQKLITVSPGSVVSLAAPARGTLFASLPKVNVLKTPREHALQILRQAGVDANLCAACYLYGPGQVLPHVPGHNNALARALQEGYALRGPRIARILGEEERLGVQDALWEAHLTDAARTKILFVGPSLLPSAARA